MSKCTFLQGMFIRQAVPVTCKGSAQVANLFFLYTFFGPLTLTIWCNTENGSGQTHDNYQPHGK